METPKERAKRVKRETKEAAVKAKAEAKRQLAEVKATQAKQKAIEKVRRRVCPGKGVFFLREGGGGVSLGKRAGGGSCHAWL